MSDEGGQASVELVAAIPLLLAVAVACLQLLATGYSLTLADGAAEAGALAIAADLPPAPAVESALPGWARDRVELEHEGGRLTVKLRPPSPVAELANALEVRSTVWVRPAPGGDG